MPRTAPLQLTEAQIQELKELAANPPRAYLGRRAKALLMVAEGQKLRDVARAMNVSHVTVGEWRRRYMAEGVKGLHIRPGRGRKPKKQKKRLMPLL